jgi:Uma2 family endonuclease
VIKKKNPDQVRETPATYEDYAALDDGKRYELADGELQLMSPSPGLMHQAISNELQHKLNEGCRKDYLIFSAPIDVIFSETEVRQPDLLMVHESRKSILTKRGVEGAPDLVVEITSPHSLKRDKIQKAAVYARYGVPEYWIVDPTNFTLEQLILKDERYDLIDVYAEEEVIHSAKINCARFSMQDLTKKLPDLPS